MNILILGASYGSLLAIKLLLAKHNVCLVCREKTAEIINEKGIFVEIKPDLTLDSKNLNGKLLANVPTKINPADYNLAVLAMMEPQYNEPDVQHLLDEIARQQMPCLSLMNLPPLPFLLRFKNLQNINFENCFQCFDLWQKFNPENVTLCSPDPQAFRPNKNQPNFLRVGLPTNFKSAPFALDKHNAILAQLANDIESHSDVPVKLKLSDSIFTPFAKWSMLMCGNYRCILPNKIISICDAVHGDIEFSRTIYDDINNLLLKMGGKEKYFVNFEKYANAALSLAKPSSVARSIDAGIKDIERVDLLIANIAGYFNFQFTWLEEITRTIDERLSV